MRIVSIIGARPQFIKAAVVSAALAERGIDEEIVHTGQHYDFALSAVFFEQLRIPVPKHHLGVGSASHAEQTGRIMWGVEKILNTDTPDYVLVYGDTNSTLAGALAAAKLNIRVAHVEAGLRSFNRRMPEEINRIVADHVSDLLFAPTAVAVRNLRHEGVDEEKIVETGDVMFDSVVRFRASYEEKIDGMLAQVHVDRGEYFVATIHRAENTDDAARLAEIAEGLTKVSALAPVIWPVHPRTRKRLADCGIKMGTDVRIIDPIGYFEMQALLMSARGVLTDSGGLQKEAAFHGVPTLTLRTETEWPETVEAGCNSIVGTDPARMLEGAMKCTGRVRPPAGFGSGDASKIIAESLIARGR